MILYYWVLRGIACFSLRRNSPARFSFLILGTTSSQHMLKRVALLHLSKAPERFINRISIEKSSRTSGRRVAQTVRVLDTVSCNHPSNLNDCLRIRSRALEPRNWALVVLNDRVFV